jgi:AraC-like DNA-binding protein
VSDRHANPAFRGTTPGIEALPGRFNLPRHRHLRAYATVVLAGQFEESGYVGRLRASAGDVLIHPALDCHENRMVTSGATLIRLDWNDVSGSGGLYRVDDVDLLARTAEKDVVAAACLLEDLLRRGQPPTPGQRNDWPDLLAAALARNASIEVGAWADANGLARETVSRGFAAAYGTVPIVFRAELRARAAWLRITRGAERLSAIAADTGFADQAHMTRWIHRLTGATPVAWRRDQRDQSENRGSPSTIVRASAGRSPLAHVRAENLAR